MSEIKTMILEKIIDSIKTSKEYIEKLKTMIPESVKEILFEIAEISLYASLFLVFSKDIKKNSGINYKNYIIFATVGGIVSYLLKNDKDISRVIKTTILATSASQAMLNKL